jgi:hypothetical protein
MRSARPSAPPMYPEPLSLRPIRRLLAILRRCRWCATEATLSLGMTALAGKCPSPLEVNTFVVSTSPNMTAIYEDIETVTTDDNRTLTTVRCSILQGHA